MIRPTAIELNGLRVVSSADSLVVDYVYPGTIDIHIVHGITLKTTDDAKKVRLGRLLTKRTAERIMDDRSWQWEPNAVAKTRAWVQHVLLADSLQQSQSYEHEGQVVLVGHRLPPRAAEVSLYAAGFRPSLATWRAAATDERRARLPEFVRALGGDAAASAAQLAAPTEQPKERAQHVWMRWHAIFQTALELGGRTYQMRGRPTLYDNELEIELRHASSKSKLTLRFGVSKHPVLFSVNFELGEDRQQRELLAWEDLPALTEEISAAITAQTKGRRPPATATREVRPRAGAEALKQLARRLHALLTGSVRIGGHRYHMPLGEVVGDQVEVSFNSDGPYRLTLYVAPRQEREVDLRGELTGEDGVTIARFDSTVIQLSELIAMNETSFVRWFGIPAVPERKLAPPTEDAPFEEARSALKVLGLPPKKYAYYLRRAEEAIGDGKAYAPIVARARRAAEKLSGVTNPATPAARPPKGPPDAGVPAVDVTLDTFNTQPGWRAQQVRSRANGFVLAVFPEGRDMDAAVASVDVIDGEIDEVRWLDERVTQSVRDVITDRLERALWAAYRDEEAGDEDDDTPRPSPLQDLIDLMERRGHALGARAVKTADLGRKDGYANIASALRDLARPTGPTAEDLQRWLEAAGLMSAGEIVGHARGAGATSVRQIMRDLWAAVFEVLTREQVAGRPGALRVSAEAIFHDDDGDFVLQRVHQGDREVVRRVRVRVGELDEDTDEVQVEDPTERLASGATLHRAERPEQFFIDLYGKLGAFHDDLERAPRTLQDVRTLLYWAAVMLDAPLCQGEVKARAAAAFTQAKAFYDTARRALIEGRSVDAVRRMHEALARISSAAAEIARSCAEGQIEITVTPPHLPVLPADKVAINGLTSLRWRDDEPMRRPPETPAAPQVAMQAHRHVAGPPVAMAGADRPRRSAAQADTRGRIDWDTIAAESERRVSEKEGELVAMMDRLTRIYSGGRLAGKRLRPGTIVVERVNGTPEFSSLVLPNLATIADGIDVGAAVAIVGLMPLEVALAGWVDPGGKPTPEGDRLTAALKALGTEASRKEFEATRDALWEEAERAGVAVEIAWRLYTKSGGPTPRASAVATSLPPVAVRTMPHLRYLLELHLRQIPSDAHASVISRWIRPPHDHIEAGEGAWQRVLDFVRDHSTCSQCPFVLGSNLDCETCRTWVLSLKRPGAAWTAERIGAALYNCDEPAVATAAVEALAQSTQAPLTAAFFRDFADNFEARLTKQLKRPEDMSRGDRDHCRKAVEWLLPQPDFPLPEYPPSKGAPHSITNVDILMRAAPVSAGWRY